MATSNLCWLTLLDKETNERGSTEMMLYQEIEVDWEMRETRKILREGILTDLTYKGRERSKEKLAGVGAVEEGLTTRLRKGRKISERISLASDRYLTSRSSSIKTS